MLPRLFRGRLIIGVCLLGTTVGCQEEEPIKRVTEPRATTINQVLDNASAEEVKPEEAKGRLLAAIIVADDGGNDWYIKLFGPKKIVSDVAADFDKFCQGLRLTNKSGAEPTWDHVPMSFEKVPPKNQFITFEFKVGGGDKPARLTISTAGGGALSNVNRWRKNDLDLAPLNHKQFAKLIRTETVNGLNLLRLDLYGKVEETLAKMPMMPGKQ